MSTHPIRADGPFSAPNLLQRATPFIGASVLIMALQPGSDLTNLPPTHAAALCLSVFLILSPLWRHQFERLPRALHPLPASLALTLGALPILGPASSYLPQLLSLSISITIPFLMQAVPWGRLPRWGETLALLAAVAPILLGHPISHTDEMVAFPMTNSIILFFALYGSRVELVAGLGIVALHFGLPSSGEQFTLVEVARDVILTSLTAVVAVCVFQVVTIMRRQQVTIREDERLANLRESWIQSVLENTADALVTIDVAGRIRSVNRAGRVLFGYTDQELLGRPINLFIADEGQADFGAYLAARMRHGDGSLGSGPRETMGIRNDDETFPVEYSAGETEQDGTRVFIVSLRDITDRKAKHAVLEHKALHDPLTGLPNRTLLDDRLSQSLAQAERHGRRVALLMLDFNHFKAINDRLGHDVGDRVLRELSRRIKAALRAGDTVARIGGDEFVVLPAAAETYEAAVHVAEKILEVTEAPLVIDGHEIDAGVSIGIALYPEHGNDPQSVLRRADQAMYLAKRSGSGYMVAPDSISASIGAA